MKRLSDYTRRIGIRLSGLGRGVTLSKLPGQPKPARRTIVNRKEGR